MFRMLILSLMFLIECNCEVMLDQEYLLCSKTNQMIEISEEECGFNDYNCHIWMNSLKDAQRADGHFTKIGGEMVIYSENNQIYNASCIKTKHLVVKNHTIDKDICLKLLPVMINDQFGYLSKDGIVLNEYDGSPCPVNDENFFYEGLHIKIKDGNCTFTYKLKLNFFK
jgi:hypothetical protein